jgi:catechol 2,3-dioxygenase-like lactoylglutathione lyase family enzyme
MTAKIRHIAVLAQDTEKLANFYKEAFGMKEVQRQFPAIYVSDGYINLAILPANGRKEGIYHFGFHVEDVKGAEQKILDCGGSKGPERLPRDGRFAEVYVHDPVQTRVDLSSVGWKA